MRTLEEVKGRCFVNDEGHWIWRGGSQEPNRPKIYAPDLAQGGKMRSQPGGRVVVQLATGKPIPNGWRVFSTCSEDRCLHPDHWRCAHPSVMGKHWTKTGVLRGSIKRTLANRRIGAARSKLTREAVSDIMASTETLAVLAERWNISISLASKVRLGKSRVFQPVAGVFSGLLAANDSGRRRA